MSNLGPLYDKFMAAPASPPWPPLSGMVFPLTVMGDIDGDGRGEVVALLADPYGMLPPSLGILSYFEDAAISARWSVQPDLQMVATAVIPVQTNPSLPPPYVVQQGAIVAADQIATVFFDNQQTLSVWQYAPQTGYAQIFVSKGGTIAGTASWTLAPQQTFLAGDFDGDGADELVIYDGQQTLGILQWSAGTTALSCLSSQTSFRQPSSQDPWSIAAGAVLWVGDVNNDGRDEILVLSSQTELAVLAWDGDELVVLAVASQQIPNQSDGGEAWPLATSSMTLTVADLDGDGKNEILAFTAYLGAGGPPSLGVLAWNGQALCMVGQVTAQVPGAVTGALDFFSQTVFAACLTSTTNVSICISAPGLGLSIAQWSLDQGFTLEANEQSSVPPSGSGPAWSFTSDTIVACSDVNGDGLFELIVQSSSAGAIAVLQWTNGNYETFWYGTVGQGTAAPLQNWGMGLLYAAPATAFTAFAGKQGEIYNDLSTSLDPSISASGGIRAEYGNSANATGTFAQWQQQLYDHLPSAAPRTGREPGVPTWSWMSNYAPEDIEAVFTQIMNELDAVSMLYGASVTMSAYLTALQNQRTQDIATVLANLVVTPPPGANVPYWPGQIIMAAMWGIAALAGVIEVGGVALAATFSVGASVLGSVLAQPADGQTGQLPATTVVQYSNLTAQNANSANEAALAASQQMALFLTDPVKLALIATLTEGPWPIGQLSSLLSAAASSNFNRFYYYQMLMPTVFQWTKWEQTSASAPWIATGNSRGGWMEAPLQVGGNAPPFWPGRDGLYMLRAFNSSIENPVLPGSDLVNDLFTTLTLSPLDLIENARNWNFSVNLYSIGDETDTQNMHFYITNATDVPIWLTIYDHGKIKEAHWVPPGGPWPTGTYNSLELYYKIRGQYDGWSGKRWDTEITPNFGMVESGATATYGNWLTFIDGGSNVYWQCDN